MENLVTSKPQLAGGCDAQAPGPKPSFKGCSFGQALEWLKTGAKVRRAIWKGHWFLATETVCHTNSGTGGYVRGFNFKQLIVAVLADDGGCVPAQPYQADILANDWEIAFDA